MSKSAIVSQIKTLVSLATYNESENLPLLVKEIHSVAEELDILVIDDNSPDGTGKLADELAASDNRIHVLHRTEKLGLGTATVAAFQWAIEQQYDCLLNMDADFSHHPRYIPDMLDAIKDVDVAIGSRYVEGGGVVGWGWRRKWMSAAINYYARFFLRLPIRDTSGAYRCYRLEKLREFDFSKVRSRGYSFQEEMLFHYLLLNANFREVPIIFEDRRAGESKINGSEAISALWILLRLGIRFRLLGRGSL